MLYIPGMNESASNPVLEQLRVIRGSQERMEKNLHDIRQRLSSLERGQARNHAEYAELYGDRARRQASMDALSERILRIEKRLEPTPPA